MAKVTNWGRITLPKEVREALRLVPGSQVEFRVEPGRVILRRARSEAMDRWVGYLRGKIPSVDELMEELRGERLPPEGEPLR
jgi:AbrB family looped-hinge helix DNA binding protein